MSIASNGKCQHPIDKCSTLTDITYKYYDNFEKIFFYQSQNKWWLKSTQRNIIRNPKHQKINEFPKHKGVINNLSFINVNV